MSSPLHTAIKQVHTIEDWIIENIFMEYGVQFTYLAFGFVFFWFGLQKPLPIKSPVRDSIQLFIYPFGLSIDWVIIFIGFYEMILGILFFFRKLRSAFILFIPHQLVTFSVLFVIPHTVFQPPWISLLGFDIPWILDSFSAFILKNLVFVGAFMLLAIIEYDKKGDNKC